MERISVIGVDRGHQQKPPLTKTLAATNGLLFPDLLNEGNGRAEGFPVEMMPPAEINVVEGGRVDDDTLLDSLLDDDLSSDHIPGKNNDSPENEYYHHPDVSKGGTTSSTGTASNQTPSTQTEVSASDEEEYGNMYNPQEQQQQHQLQEDYVNEVSACSSSLSSVSTTRSGDNEEADDEEASRTSGATSNLLERAHSRIAYQNLQDEVSNLHAIIEQKEHEVEILSGQLRRAVSTKCDLVIAHTELERHHEHNLNAKEKDVKKLKKSYTRLKEHQAEVERQFLNELVKVSDELKQLKESHQQELDDWERMHRNEMLEKDYEIATLAEEVRKLKGEGSVVSQEVDGIWVANDDRSVPPHKMKKSSGLKVMFRKS